MNSGYQLQRTSEQPYDMAVMLVFIDRIDNQVPYGRIKNCYLPETLYFSGLMDMILQIDSFCDKIGFSAASDGKSDGKWEGKRYNTLADFIGEKGEVATLQLHIQYRENASWQGSLICTSHTAKQRYEIKFRSVLELIQYVADVLGLRR